MGVTVTAKVSTDGVALPDTVALADSVGLSAVAKVFTVVTTSAATITLVSTDLQIKETHTRGASVSARFHVPSSPPPLPQADSRRAREVVVAPTLCAATHRVCTLPYRPACIAPPHCAHCYWVVLMPVPVGTSEAAEAIHNWRKR